jgi:hypothetical protein
MRLTEADGEPTIIAAGYRLQLDRRRLVAHVRGTDDRRWFALRLLHAFNTLDGPDETLSVEALDVRRREGSVVISIRCGSSRWASRWCEVRCDDEGLSVRGGVRGAGRLLSVDMLGGFRPPSGFLPSGSSVRSAFSPNPDHPRRVIRAAVESATIGVVGAGSEPGVGRWLFTPAPWCFAVSREERVDELTAPDGEWVSFGLAVPVEEQNFTNFHYLPVTDGFSLRLDYEGHTSVDGDFLAPRLDVAFGASDPYAAVARHGEAIRAEGLAPASGGPVSDWWREPIFCGWGAQCARAEVSGRPAAAECTQSNYDEFLTALSREDVRPGTIVVDDKWAVAYASACPDPVKWPDLRGWIAQRHDAGQRVLLWYKAWDPEGAPESACVRSPGGAPVAIDPQSPAGRQLVVESVAAMLGPAGLDADGFKVDFTATTPSGVSLSAHGPSWGAALLHELLAVVHTAAKSAKSDAMVVTHAPNPAFADVSDVIRLNDALMLDSPSPAALVADHMTHRARIVRAAVPGKPIDTDGWCMPDRAQWRDYLIRQPDLGVPALYYAEHFDHSREPMGADDFALLRAQWARYRARAGA